MKRTRSAASGQEPSLAGADSDNSKKQVCLAVGCGQRCVVALLTRLRLAGR